MIKIPTHMSESYGATILDYSHDPFKLKLKLLDGRIAWMKNDSTGDIELLVEEDAE